MRFVGNLLACALVAWSLLWLCRWIKRQDRLIGLIVELGLALRLWSGLLLFGISYLKLPILQRLYLGDGFWDLAPDARGYFWGATIAAEEGLRTVADWSASPAFVKVLALWMRAVGTSPASAVLLNACSYVGIAAILVAARRRDQSTAARRAVLLSVLAFTLSPALLVFGTQALKDQFFTLLMVAACAAIWAGFSALRASPRRRDLGTAAAAVVTVALLTYLIAGIRPYLSFLLVLILAAVLAAGARRKTLRQAPAYLGACLLIVAILWTSFKLGAGAYYGYYESSLLRTVGITVSPQPVGALLAAREGFIKAGGATNVVPRIRHREGAGLLVQAWEHAAQLALGTAVVLVPISLLRWLSVVDFEGGRGLLMVTDLDTLFIDLTGVAVAVLLWRSWRSRQPNFDYAVFTATLCAVVTGLMAFVVTNYGSLFRLRLMTATLLWVLPLAMVRVGADAAAASQPDGGAFARAAPR
jgi:hypothetical protein